MALAVGSVPVGEGGAPGPRLDFELDLLEIWWYSAKKGNVRGRDVSIYSFF